MGPYFVGMLLLAIGGVVGYTAASFLLREKAREAWINGYYQAHRMLLKPRRNVKVLATLLKQIREESPKDDS